MDAGIRLRLNGFSNSGVGRGKMALIVPLMSMALLTGLQDLGHIKYYFGAHIHYHSR